MMDRVPHNSGLVQATGYDPETRTAEVELLHGRGTYQYHDVPPEDMQSFRAADSVGGHFNSVFKPAHGHKARKKG